MFSIKEVKASFFDTKRVMSALDRAGRAVLSKFGAYVRTAARHSIRKRKAVSKPGQPPSSHAGQLRDFLWFAYDTERRSVVIGPARLSDKPGNAPEALEYGGHSQAAVGPGRRLRTINIAKRPFMGPAYEQEKDKLPSMWANSVK